MKKEKTYKDLKVGDTVIEEPERGIASGGRTKITKITSRTIWCGDTCYSRKTGNQLGNPYIKYYLIIPTKK